LNIEIPNNWTPRRYQYDGWKYFQDGGTRGVFVCHRRWGKDDVALHLAATKAMQEPATYWHMLPKATQARKAIWLAVNPHTGNRRIDEAFPEAIRKRANDNEMFIEFKNGSFWHVVGSDNYDNLVGSPPKGIVFSEWALCNPQAWAYLEPILIENGGWAAFIYSSRGKNHGYRLYNSALNREGWFATLQGATQTPVFSADELEDVRKGLIDLYGEDMGNAIFNQEYHSSFEAGVPGSYYSAELAKAEEDGRIASVPYESGIPVRVYFDLGNAPNLVMWFAQYVGLEPRVIDHERPNATGVDEIARVLREKRYNYSELVLPHDGGHKQMGDAKGRTFATILEDATNIPTRVMPRTDLLPGIQAVYPFIRKMHMDKVNCEKGLDALYSYKRVWDDKLMKFKDEPLHDWASHDSDGFRYMAVDMKPASRGSTLKPPRELDSWMAA
jgi:phage terminase large subunit